MERSSVDARQIARVVIATFVAVVLLPWSGLAQTRAPEDLVDGFVRTWNAHDIKSLAQLFTEDADFVNVAGDRLDLTRLQAELEQVHGTFFKASAISSTGVSTRSLRPDVAIVHFTWQMDGQVDMAGKPVGRRHGIITIVAVKLSEGWKITALQNTNVREQPPKSG